MFRKLFITLLALMCFGVTMARDNEPDFNFPKNVTEQAQADLKQALAKGEGQLLVDALVRSSLAQSSITIDNMSAIIDDIDKVARKDSRPDIRAILYHLQARIMHDYCENFTPADRRSLYSLKVIESGKVKDKYALWDSYQFERTIDSLVRLSLHDQDALLQCPVKSYDKIIRCDDLGAKYLPTLYHFLNYRGEDLVSDKLEEQLTKEMETATPDDLTATMFARCNSINNGYDHEEKYFKLYQQYANHAESGLPLSYLSGDKYYDNFRDYVRQFPKSIYANDIRNSIIHIERKEAGVSYNGHLNSKFCAHPEQAAVKVKLKARNINDLTVRLYRLPEDIDDQAWRKKDLTVKDLTLVAEQAVHIDGTVPFDGKTEVTFAALPYGRYTIVPVYKNDGKWQIPKSLDKSDRLTVYDLASFNVSEATSYEPQLVKEGEPEPLTPVRRIIVVDDATGKPVAGATVGNSDWHATTAKDGTVDLPKNIKNNFYYLVSKGDDHYGPETRLNSASQYGSNRLAASVYTDLGIYRPGEAVKWSAILYEHGVESRKVLANTEVFITVKDANWKVVDEQTATTDTYGRIHGETIIQQGRLLGNYHISVGLSKGGNLGSTDFQVSEYKTPTFFVEFPQEERAFKLDEPITVTGRAATYSSMPVADAEVKLKLTRRSWYWGWWYYRPMRERDDEVCDTIVRTDAQGKFSVTFSNANFYELNHGRYYSCRYRYIAHAQVTDATGESQETTAGFHIGSKREIVLAPTTIDYNNIAPLRLPLTVNTTDTTAQAVTLNYRITGTSIDTIRGTLSSDNPVIDLTRLTSGSYHLRVHFPDEDDNYAHADINLYRKTDDRAPIADQALWIPEDGYYIDDRNVAHVTIGTSTPEAHIYYVATGRNRVLGDGWVHRNKAGFSEFTFLVPAKVDEVLHLHFMAFHHGKHFENEISMVVPACQQTLKVTATSFRDRLVPGKPERWSFTLKDRNGKPQQGAVMLEMFDKALNSLSDNTWSFSPNYYHVDAASTGFMRHASSQSMSNDWRDNYLDTKVMNYSSPVLYTYDREFWRGCDNPFYEPRNEVYYSMGARAVAKSLAPAESRSMAMTEEVEESGGEAKQPAVDRQKLEQVEMRLSDVKTALWQPMLTTDKDGNLTLEFDAPNFNTTWLVQAIAYTSGLANDMFNAEVLTQKPIMVKPSLPRFVRQGDVTRLAANLQNASDHAITTQALIEAFDPRTGQVYAQQSFNETIESQATRPLTMVWTVPDTIPYVGFRVRAVGDDFGDGEQVMLPVLTATSPIVETQPFYIDPDQSQYTFTMPDVPQNARVTLEYADNPVWYCVTALPSIFSDNTQVATSLAHSLYALNVARGIANSQPIIREAFTYWQDNAKDSMLVSALDRNADLKIGTLVASPWLRTSERQTLQMQQLADYFDADKSRAEHDRLVNALAALQQSDGGFTWYTYPGCKSSRWVTGEVLELLGNLRQLGYQPGDERLNQMITRALDYYDRETITLSKKKENKKALYATWAYTRSLFGDIAMSKDARKLYNKTVKQMAKRWGKMDLSLTSKAFYAMTLQRAGKHNEAMRLVESLRQFASIRPEIGMYWDQYRNERWFTPSQVAATSVILRAMNEVDPRTAELDQVRKWMLQCKRTTDWGGSSLAADAVQALLSTGSQWIDRSHTPAISIDGKEVALDRFDSFIGYSRRDVDAHVGSTFTIQRSGNSPAWGGIYWQYTLPMQDVKPASIREMSIDKQFVALDAAERPAGTTLHVGDKVRVTLTITLDQAMDYVMVNDERASCFEPVDKTSGYRWQEGIGHYRETRDSGTRLFFSHLNKGTHVITYDVYATAPGTFASGVATIQSQQAPEMTAHTAGQQLTVQ